MHLLKNLFILILLICLGGCSQADPAIRDQLDGSDSLVINFNTPETQQIKKTIQTSESKAIRKLTQFVSGKKTELYKCGFDGNLLFYKNGSLAGDFSFHFSVSGCRHFVQLKDGQLKSSIMSDEAADFLRGLAEGRNWY